MSDDREVVDRDDDRDGDDRPEVGLIVKFDPLAGPSGEWQDELGRDWSDAVRFNLPDLDVFAINAGTLTETANWPSVGTILFNMIPNPVVPGRLRPIQLRA